MSGGQHALHSEIGGGGGDPLNVLGIDLVSTTGTYAGTGSFNIAPTWNTGTAQQLGDPTPMPPWFQSISPTEVRLDSGIYLILLQATVQAQSGASIVDAVVRFSLAFDITTWNETWIVPVTGSTACKMLTYFVYGYPSNGYTSVKPPGVFAEQRYTAPTAWTAGDTVTVGQSHTTTITKIV